MNKKEFYHFIRNYADEIERQGWKTSTYHKILFEIFERTVVFTTDNYDVYFSTLFARVSFLTSSTGLTRRQVFILHRCRKALDESGTAAPQVVGDLLKQGINTLVSRFLEEEVFYEDREKEVFNAWHESGDAEINKYIDQKRVYLWSVSPKEKKAVARDIQSPYDDIHIRYSRPEINEDYTAILTELKQSGHLPVACNLIDVQVDGAGYWHPSSIVLEPDNLYDVTAVSECFGAFSTHHMGYLLRRFIDKPASLPLIIGNLANFILDQLIFKPDIEFKQIVSQLFQLYPLAITRFSDEEVQQLVGQLSIHFKHIQKIVQNDLNGLGINRSSCYLEPSFYSAKYGIQGRLDLFALDGDKAFIVELKSGSPYRPNSYGLSNNHYHQTLLYDLLIESVFTKRVKRSSFMLYSKEPARSLRYAPALRSEQREALKVRNQCWLIDRAMVDQNDLVKFIIEYGRSLSRNLKGFLAKDFAAFTRAVDDLEEVERDYFNACVRFVLTEQGLAKLGEDGGEKRSGLAGLWRDAIEAKKDRFSILNHLEIVRNHSMKEDPSIDLQRSPLSAELSNFRTGDIAVFYPDLGKKDGILRNQVFKCSIVAMDSSHVRIRLRSKQENAEIFRQYDYWHLEHDVLENGYSAMTRSVFTFLRAPRNVRQKLLGLEPPARYETTFVGEANGMTSEQHQVLSHTVSSKDYYLVWGPPGTGKTSILFREIARYYRDHTADRLLFMAYTNRAVDEMCKALQDLDSSVSFVRVGSRYSTSPRYKKHLLREKIRGIDSRSDLKEYLCSQRIYVGTVASMMGRRDLFDLVSFDLAVIDEASQILEPALVGLLSKVKKFVMIGDHLQLPAVVLQAKQKYRKTTAELRKLGIVDLSNSLFERMYRQAKEKGWDHAVGVLTQQGRMHEELMQVPNHLFYQGFLKILPGLPRLHRAMDAGARPLLDNRLLFIPTEVDVSGENLKENQREARLVVDLVNQILGNFERSGRLIKESSIGIITPFRAQIARINRLLASVDDERVKKITVDTVERYQGSARDIVIFSTAINTPFQMNALISCNDDGVDRKLNVAFTRAREQFILLGRENLLRNDPSYRYLIEQAVKVESEVLSEKS